MREINCPGAALVSGLDSTLPPSLTASSSGTQFDCGFMEGWRFCRPEVLVHF